MGPSGYRKTMTSTRCSPSMPAARLTNAPVTGEYELYDVGVLVRCVMSRRYVCDGYLA